MEVKQLITEIQQCEKILEEYVNCYKSRYSEMRSIVQSKKNESGVLKNV